MSHQCNGCKDEVVDLNTMFTDLLEGITKMSYVLEEPLGPDDEAEYLFAYAKEDGAVKVTDHYYTEDEFEKVADELGAENYEAILFTEQASQRSIN